MRKFALVSALALAVCAGAAQAATMLVTFSQGSAPGAINFSFLQDSNPTPTDHGYSWTTVPIWGWNGNLPSDMAVTWYTSGAGGLFWLDGPGFGMAGPQAFTNSTSSPVFAPFVFVDNDPGSSLHGTLTIAYAPAAAPEPAMWVMLVAGFGLLGLALRSRRAVAA